MKRIVFSVFIILTTLSLAYAELYPELRRKRGDILYKLKDHADTRKRNSGQAVINKYRGKRKKSFSGNKMHLDRLELESNKTEEDICNEMMATGVYEWAEPNYLHAPDGITNDPYSYKQWHLWHLQILDAWKYTRGNASMVISHGDTGLYNHTDFNVSLILPGWCTVTNTSNTTQVFEHGTVATIIAVPNNQTGVAGICPNVQFYPIRVSTTSDGFAYTDNIVESVDWAYQNASSKVHYMPYSVAGSDALNTSCTAARAAGTVCLCSVGNSGSNITVIPQSEAILVVGGVKEDGTRASNYSSYGTPIDLVAPGSNIFTTSGSTSYAMRSGNSYSTPIVAGVIALMWSINPNLTLQELECLLLNATDDMGDAGWDIYYGWGRLNASKAALAAWESLEYENTTQSSQITLIGNIVIK